MTTFWNPGGLWGAALNRLICRYEPPQWLTTGGGEATEEEAATAFSMMGSSD